MFGLYPEVYLLTLNNMALFSSINSIQRVATSAKGTVVYETLNFVSSGNTTVTGNGTTTASIFKTSGTNAVWDNQAYINTAYLAPCTIEFNKQAGATDNSASYAMIGWNSDPTTNASYDTLDHASYPYMTNNYYTYNNGAGSSPGAAWDPAQKFYIVYGLDNTIKHYNGSTLLYTAAITAGTFMYLDSAYYNVNGTTGGFTNIRICKRAWNGLGYF